MNSVSVIIPVYNGEQFLASAIQSVLAQTHGPLELIIVDDGSTDGTAQVIRGFDHDKRLNVIKQDNHGPAAARNVGIATASNEIIAFLDSDDEWMPNFLESMLALAEANPDGIVFYCAAQCIDGSGKVLPQLAGAKAVAPEAMYQTLLDANFLIPTTVLVRRSSLVSAGGFDASNPSLDGCEDWDLWLRLACAGKFVGTLNCLARYRLHETSASANVARMQKAVQTLVEKHFGPNAGYNAEWDYNKRRAYGGYYRYCILSSITRQGDWEAAATYLLKALALNPVFAVDIDLFYELALGEQPLGYRGTSHNLDLEQNDKCVVAMLESVFGSAQPDILQLRRKAMGTAYVGLGLVAYNTRQHSLARRYLKTAGRFRPELWVESRFVMTFLKSLVKPAILDRLKNIGRTRAVPRRADSRQSF